MNPINRNMKNDAQGFTLVELAIVMIIIGLLIGGILKGQELITNARVAATVSQMKGVDAAVSTFRDSYSAWPGDIVSPSTRLPNCAAATTCGQTIAAGTGNGRIEQNNFTGSATVNNESHLFWTHLAAADIFAGVQNNATVAWGQAYPAADIGGGYHVSFSTDGNVPGRTATAAGRAGTYIALHSGAAAIPAATQGIVAAELIRRIDEKMDDGAPNLGTVLAMGTVAANTGCADVAGAAGVYPVEGQSCGLFVRIQQ